MRTVIKHDWPSWVGVFGTCYFLNSGVELEVMGSR